MSEMMDEHSDNIAYLIDEVVHQQVMLDDSRF